MTPPAVSVIVPCYSHPRFLPGALQSAFAQTLSDIEVIVVDDGSPNDVRGIVAPFATSGRLRYVRQENRGISGARNTGRRHASAPFLAFLDEDDAWAPDKLEQQLAVLRAHDDVALVFCDGYRIYENGSPAQVPLFQDYKALRQRVSWVRPGAAAVLPAGSLGLDEFLRGIVLTTSAVVRAEAFDAAGGFDERIRNGEDIDFFFRLHRRHGFAYLDRQLFHYRLTDGSLSRSGAKTLRDAHQLAAHLATYPLDASDRKLLLRHTGNLEWDLAYQALLEGRPGEARGWVGTAFRKVPRLNRASLALATAALLPAALFNRLRALRSR